MESFLAVPRTFSVVSQFVPRRPRSGARIGTGKFEKQLCAIVEDSASTPQAIREAYGRLSATLKNKTIGANMKTIAKNKATDVGALLAAS